MGWLGWPLEKWQMLSINPFPKEEEKGNKKERLGKED